jgi:hypothetical protein
MGTNWTAINDFETMLESANTYAPFWPAMLMMIWIILLITFVPLGFGVAVIGSGFLALVLGLFLVYMELMSWKWLLMILGSLIAIVIWETLFKKKES